MIIGSGTKNVLIRFNLGQSLRLHSVNSSVCIIIAIHILDISWLTMGVTKETTGHPNSKHQAWSSSGSPHLIAKPDIGGIFLAWIRDQKTYGAMNGAPRNVDPQRRQKVSKKVKRSNSRATCQERTSSWELGNGTCYGPWFNFRLDVHWYILFKCVHMNYSRRADLGDAVLFQYLLQMPRLFLLGRWFDSQGGGTCVFLNCTSMMRSICEGTWNCSAKPSTFLASVCGS